MTDVRHAMADYGSDTALFSDPEEEAVSEDVASKRSESTSFPTRENGESHPASSLAHDVSPHAYDTEEVAEESDSSCDFSCARRTAGDKQPRDSSNASTPFRPRANKRRSRVPESSGDESDEQNATSSSKDDTSIQEIKSMLHLLCEKVEKNERTLRELQTQTMQHFRLVLHVTYQFSINFVHLHSETPSSSSSECTPKRVISPRVRVSVHQVCLPLCLYVMGVVFLQL